MLKSFSLETCYPYAYYLLLIVFTLSGVVKFTEFYQNDAAKKFVSLPRWFWSVAAVWELLISATLYLDQHLLALYLTFIILGGIYYALFSIKDVKGKTLVAQSFGLALIPASVCVLAGVIVTLHHKFPLLPLFLSAGVGVVVGKAVEVKK